jgi:[ribosomal protein S5]-alanine N-acetyltransferase
MNINIFDQFPTLETKRVSIIQMQNTDLELIYDFNSCLESLKYVAREPYTSKKTAQEKLSFFLSENLKRTAFWWTFTLKESGEKIGYGGLFNICDKSSKAEIGYALLKKYWNQNYMSEALHEIINFGMKKAKFHKIYGVILDGNIPSIKLLEKNGFKKEAHLKDHSYARGQYFDECIYGLINDN